MAKKSPSPPPPPRSGSPRPRRRIRRLPLPLPLLTSLMGKRNTPRSGTHPRASFALLSRFYATLFLSLSICLSIPKKTLLVLLRPTVIVNIPRSESARTRLTSCLQLSRSGFRLGLLVLNHTNRKRYSRPPKNRLF
jgi:hypothetical protein